MAAPPSITFSIRIRQTLRDRIENAAKGADRSLNAEIAQRLQSSFESPATLEWQARRIADLRDALSRVFAYADAARSDDRSEAADSARAAFWHAMDDLEGEAKRLDRRPSLGELHPGLLRTHGEPEPDLSDIEPPESTPPDDPLAVGPKYE